MERGERWSSGNNHVDSRVAGDVKLPTSIGSRDQEDLTTTTTMAPVSMAHLEQYADTDWVEPTDELTGTAVFDATGDKTAMPSWDELVRQHADRVYRLAYRLSGNQHDAEDLTQETFIRVFRSVPNYQPGTFEGWLHRITTNLFLDWSAGAGAFGWRRCRRTTSGCRPTSRIPSRSTTIRGSARTCRPRLTRCLRNSRGRGAVRHRGSVLRGNRRHPGRQARHGAQPNPPRWAGPARLSGQPCKRHGRIGLSVRRCRLRPTALHSSQHRRSDVGKPRGAG